MKDLSWSDTLSVEVKEIDDDHRKLVDLFNALIHSINDGDDPAYVDAVLEELISCTIWHFRHEERDVQNMNLVRQDVLFKAILKDHDVVEGDGTANQC